MMIQRHFTDGSPVFETCEWEKRRVEIVDVSGEVVFEQDDVEVPKSWSQNATDVLASKYFRKSGVPETGRETSLRQVVQRMAGKWAREGMNRGYIRTTEEFDIFFDEIAYMMIHQIVAPNSPQWFNTGIDSYEKGGNQAGHYCFDTDGRIMESPDAYTHPQVHACFIQPVEDQLVGPGGIMDLWEREALLFKYGSGTGTNFSNLRGEGERLNNGGTSSGLLSWLRIGDRAAGAIKSGGTTRRAAKMVVLDDDHPDLIEFINWKSREELKVRAMVEGMKVIAEEGGPDHQYARMIGLDLNYDFNGEAYATVSGQNANNSVRVSDAFMEQALNPDRQNEGWPLVSRLQPEESLHDDFNADHILFEMCNAAWRSGDPGIQYRDTINQWHTCKNDGEIRASNPCSEYFFLDNTACNLASLNLSRFIENGNFFHTHSFVHAVKLWTLVLEISVAMASYPSREIAERSWKYRTLGLGYAGVGEMLMRLAIRYDSDEARILVKAITSLMTGTVYNASGMIAELMGPFEGFENNKESMRGVLRLHREHANELRLQRWEDVSVRNMSGLVDESIGVWDRVIDHKSFRNAQATCIAPTGTISIIMDCETSGIEPYYDLTVWKKLVGGGGMMFTASAIEDALKRLNYEDDRITKIITQIEKHGLGKADIDEGDDLLFQTANGHHPISPLGHVLMMAAAQPFISGAISKTVNMPADSTPEDIREVYEQGWHHGLKALAVYRDGSKYTQPMNSVVDEEEQTPDDRLDAVAPVLNVKVDSTRKLLHDDRNARIHKFKVNGVTGYITTGEYPDGSPGEIFIRMSKAGSTVHGFCETVGRAWSLALQHGVSVQDLVDSFENIRFEPHGMTSNKDIPFTSSVVDYVAKWLRETYLTPGCGDMSPVSVSVMDEQELMEILGSPRDISPSPAPTTIAVKRPLGVSGPPCDVCGTIMTPSGKCHVCSSCGNQGGCG